MKKRILLTICMAALLTGCANPYRQEQKQGGEMLAAKYENHANVVMLSAAAEQSDSEYTVDDLINLQDFLLARPVEIPENADYDLDGDGAWSVFDLCLMRQELIEQKQSADMPTRVVEDGTKIIMHFGDTIIPGVLNDCDTARALIEMLPYTVHMSNYSNDFCGVIPDRLPYNEDEIHNGWLNGDIDYSVVAPYFTILHSNEENSQQYSNRVNIGVITCELSKIRDLSGSYDVLIELAE